MGTELLMIFDLLKFWGSLSITTEDGERDHLYRGDILTIHHPLSKFERLLLFMHGIELRIS